MLTSNDKRIPKDLQPQLIALYRRALEQGVSMEELEEKVERYLERLAVTDSYEAVEEKNREERIKSQLPRLVRYGAIILPVLFLSIGVYLVGSAVVPILGYYINTAPGLSETTVLKAPIPQEDVMDSTPVVVSQATNNIAKAQEKVEPPTIVNEQLDYTNLNNWFDQRQVPEVSAQSQDYYILDIPSLDIEDARVNIGGNDLKQSLIQYPGTAQPGQQGAPVIFGHSVLRQFYNPSQKNPQRYNSIFSYIMTLEPGDEIYVTYNDTEYTYVVQDKSEVKPEDVYILNQDYSSKRLKLVTCVPEGTYLRRGVITAQLVEG